MAEMPSVEAKPVKFGPGGFDFTSPEELPSEVKRRIMELLESGHLFRYGKFDDVAELEKEFAAYLDVPYAMACNSGGSGLFLALKALGVQSGDKVLVNSFTLLPVPSAIVHAGAMPVFVKCHKDQLQVNLEDLEEKANETGAKVLLISYMRGHVPDMDKLLGTAKRLGLKVVEDCAHTLGGKWKLDGEHEYRHIGTLGDVGVWSLQTNKSINAGEGGVVATRSQDIASYITIASGCYAHYARNGASGDLSHMDQLLPSVPNFSMRLSNIAAALARPQLRALDAKVGKFKANWIRLREVMCFCPHIKLIQKPSVVNGKEVGVMSSVQFYLDNFTREMVVEVMEKVAIAGVPLAWFGGPRKGFTVTLKEWKFADPDGEQHKRLREDYTATLLDLPLYHTSNWPLHVFEHLGDVLCNAACEVSTKHQGFCESDVQNAKRARLGSASAFGGACL